MSHRDEPVPLAESLGSVVQSLRPDSVLNPSSAPSAGATAAAMGGVFGRWEEAVGAAVAAHVQPVKLDGARLVVQVDDPAWATQLRFLEQTVKERLRAVAGASVDVLEVRVRRG